MARIKRGFKWSWWVLTGLMIFASPLLAGLVGGQSGVQASGCWTAEITQQWTDVALAGSNLRVSVHGQVGLPVVVRSIGDFYTVGFTGTKPEYGPFVAEFAPLSKGTYYIEPQGLGYVFEVWLDGKNYTRVDFTPVSCVPPATATPRPQGVATATRRPAAAATRVPPPTATPLPAPTKAPVSPPPAPPPPAPNWQGRVDQHIKKLAGRYFATIAVRVIGRPAGQQVEISTTGWSATCTTGTKPEHGPDACEFGSLNAGTYRLTPKDLGAHLDVTVDLQDFVLVEFVYTGPVPNTRWVGTVVENTSGSQGTAHVNSAIAVVVSGRPWHEVEIRSGGWSTTCTTGYKPDIGPDACEFGGLGASTYTITPKDLGTSAQVTVDGWGWAKVRFDEIPVPAPRPPSPPAQPTAGPTASPAQPTQPSPPVQALTPIPTASPQPSPTPVGATWKGWVVSNSSEHGEKTGISSTIVVRVLNWPGVLVTISAGGDWSASCITGTKPEYGPDACEVGGLWPSTYYVRPQGSDVEVEVTMDGLGTAFVEFTSR